MDVLVLIDKLDDTVHNAKPVPLTDQVRVDKEEIYDILDQMRATIPEEIKQARWIVKERQEMLAEAKRESERIIREAREEQSRLIGDEEVVKQAERQADEIVEDARAREREIRLGAEDYADDILNTLEINLEKFTAAVQRGRDRLQGREEPRTWHRRLDEIGIHADSVNGLAPPSKGRPGLGSRRVYRRSRGCAHRHLRPGNPAPLLRGGRLRGPRGARRPARVRRPDLRHPG